MTTAALHVPSEQPSVDNVFDTPASSATGMRRAIFASAVFAIALVGAYWYQVFAQWNFDDSFIVYRMVRNLIEGRGWTYNPGQLHNASTSVLNTIAVALTSLATGDIPRAAHYLGTLSIVTSSTVAYLWLHRAAGSVAGVMGAAALATLLATSATWGLETHLFVALLLLFVHLEATQRSTWVLLGFLILTRPDAILIFLFKCARQFVATGRIPWKGALLTAAVVAPWACYSLVTFQQVFPDTLSVKRWQGRSGLWGQGMIYVRGFVDHVKHAPALLRAAYTVAPLGIFLCILQRSPFLYAVLFVIAQQCAYAVLNVPGYHWYYTPFDCVMALAALMFIGAVIQRVPRVAPEPVYARASLLIISAFALTLAYRVVFFPPPPRVDARDAAYRRASQVVLERAPEGALAVLEAGSVGYYTNRPLVDLVGLTSRNPEYLTGTHTDHFFENPPAAVLLHSPPWHFENAIYRDLRFRVLYSPDVIIEDPLFATQLFIRNGTALAATRLEDFLRAHFRSFDEAPELRTLPQAPEASCIIDQLNGRLAPPASTAMARGLLQINGWAIDRAHVHHAAEVRIVLTSDTTAYVAPAVRTAREDVAAHLSLPKLTNAGFDLEASTLDLAPGRYRLGILQARGDGNAFCAFGKELELR